ncbi:MAG: hypothetical protein V1849_03645, partial [Chloroflexota bacterium]
NFVSNPCSPSFDGRQFAWEASTLPLSYTRSIRIYSNPKICSCKGGVLASSKSGTDIGSLLHGYQLCSATEGKSPNSLAIVTRSVTYLYNFLCSNGLSTDVTQIGAGELRTFILYLQQKRCFSNHPYSKAQQRGLSGHTINTYMRSIRAFGSSALQGIDLSPEK